MSSQPPAPRRRRWIPAALSVGALALVAVLLWVLRPGSHAGDSASAAAAPETARRPLPALRDPNAGSAAASATPADPVACQACMQEHCRKKTFKLDCGQLDGTVEGGHAAGRPKSEVCSAVVACIVKHGCANDDTAQPCYCGSVVDDAKCVTSGGDGPCRKVLEDAAGTDDVRTLAERWNDSVFAIAHAVHQGKCQSTICKRECSSQL